MAVVMIGRIPVVRCTSHRTRAILLDEILSRMRRHFPFFPHRAAIAFCPRAFRSAAVIAAAAAVPPFEPAVARNSIRLGGTLFLGFGVVLMLRVNRLTDGLILPRKIAIAY